MLQQQPKTQLPTQERAKMKQRQDAERFVQLDGKLLQFGMPPLSAPAIKLLYLVLTRYMNMEGKVEYPIEVVLPLSEINSLIPVITNKERKEAIFQELKTSFKIPKGIVVKGENYQGDLTWFEAIEWASDKQQKVRFRFNAKTFESILNPRFYTTLYRPEINRLKSTYAIKVFQVLRGIQNRRADWTAKTKRSFSMARLKAILGISHHGKLDSQTIQGIVTEINQHTNLQILNVLEQTSAEGLESVELTFTIRPSKKQSGGSHGGGSKKPPKKEEQNPEALEDLTWTQRLAYDKLIAFGVAATFAQTQILPSLSSAEIRGYEDFFVEELLAYFQKNTPINDANTFTKWWRFGSAFRPSGAVWQSTLKKLADFQKKLEKEQPQLFEKRLGQEDRVILLKKKTLNPTLWKGFLIQKPTTF